MRSLLEDWPVVVRRLRQAGSVALFLDFDGTLAPLEEDPRAVVLKSAVRGVLMRLAENPGVSVCVISGRRLADLRARVGVSRISYFGVHGGDTASSAFRSNAVRSLAEARRELMSRLKGVMPVSGSGSVNGFGSNKVSGGVVVEDKGMAFAVHHRRAQAAEVSYAREVLDRVVETFAGELWVVPGDCVWEVLPREIRGKGYAARRHWRLRSAGALPIYIGNDGTDEMAFAALAQGLTARVGAARQTRARYFLRSPADVARFLEKLEEETRWKQSTDSNL